MMQPNTIRRCEAKLIGLRHYFTGVPCKHGHLDLRYVAQGACVQCHAADFDVWYRRRNPTVKKRDRHRSGRRTARRKGYVPQPHERDCPPRPEDGRCQNCGQVAEARWAMSPGRASMVLHHCHETGAFLGWYCSGCNTRAG